MKRMKLLLLCAALAAAICSAPSPLKAQDAGNQTNEDEKNAAAATAPAAPAAPPAQPEQPAPEVQGGGVGNYQGFKFQPTVDNTYVVTSDLRGLTCVEGVGTPSACGVTNRAADQGGYPWTQVKCKRGDLSVSTFAWSLDNNAPMTIFEAPPSLITSAKLYKINVRLGRVCVNPATAARVKK